MLRIFIVCGIFFSILLLGCSQGVVQADPKSNNYSLVIEAPSEYAVSGGSTSIPVIIRNNSNTPLENIQYEIAQNTTGVDIAIEASTSKDCASIGANQQCTLLVNVAGGVSTGAFYISASTSNNTQTSSLLSSMTLTTQAVVGLTNVVANNESGINGVSFYYNQSISLPDNNSSTVLFTMFVTSPNVGAFNNLDIVDGVGKSLQYSVLTGNSGNGMTALHQGDTVTLAILVPNGASQISFYPSLKLDNQPIINGTSLQPITIQVLRNHVTRQANINSLPSNFNLNESHNSQVITLWNNGNLRATNLNVSMSNNSIFTISNNNCGSTLESGQSCSYVVNFDGNSDKAGTGGAVFNYSSANISGSDTSIFSYRGSMAIANLAISSATNPRFKFITTTASPKMISILTIANTGAIPIESFNYKLPVNGVFSLDNSGLNNPCQAGSVLQPNQSCQVGLAYENNNVSPVTTYPIEIEYKYIDPEIEKQLIGDSVVFVTYETMQSHAILSTSVNTVNFGNVLNNFDNTSQVESIFITNIGDIPTSGGLSLNLQEQIGLYHVVSDSCNGVVLNSGESCIVSLIAGPIANSVSFGAALGTLGINYVPYFGANLTAINVDLNTQVVTAQTAVVSVSQTNQSGFADGVGTIENPFMLESGYSGSLTYTITNTGEVPANNFVLNYNPSDLLPWVVSSTDCNNAVLAANGGSCSVTLSLSAQQPSSTTLNLSAITMNWVDQDSPRGQTQSFYNGSLYTTIYPSAQIMFTPNPVFTAPSGNSSLTATLSGGYKVQDQNISLSDNSGILSSILPNECALSSVNSLCLFTLAGRANSAIGTYNLNVTNAGSVYVPATLSMINTDARSWIGGSTLLNESTVYGAIGVESVGNMPGGRISGVTITDSSGNLWMFGGNYATNKMQNDLWKYNVTTKNWVWVAGSNITNQKGIYGTKGTESVANVAGARYISVGWYSGNNIWVFGGYGYGSASVGQLNDLWKYNITNKTWTWVSGVAAINSKGTYGTKGVESSTNTPGARDGALSWTDAQGNLWLFGGHGYDANGGTIGYLNDVWKFNVATNKWVWMSGSNLINPSSVYSGSSTPGGRTIGYNWVDLNGNFWMFGGYGNDINGTLDYMNDLWKYNPATATWTYINGGTVIDQRGVYGSQVVASQSNIPGSRASGNNWVDSSGNLWLLGGYGYDVNGSPGRMDDLWKYNPSGNTWTWVSGSKNIAQVGNYGVRNTVSTLNIISSRSYSMSWYDQSGNFWLFGGQGLDVNGNSGRLNDLWKINVN